GYRARTGVKEPFITATAHEAAGTLSRKQKENLMRHCLAFALVLATATSQATPSAPVTPDFNFVEGSYLRGRIVDDFWLVPGSTAWTSGEAGKLGDGCSERALKGSLPTDSRQSNPRACDRKAVPR